MNSELKCQKCPYKNGIVKTFVNPCISCKLGTKPLFSSGMGKVVKHTERVQSRKK